MASLQAWLSSYITWFKMPIMSITLTDILEIIILAVLVYNVLIWIRNTRAWNLLKGIAFLAVCVALIYLFQMTTLMYLINRVMSILILAAVVIFQPELRRALEQLGERGIPFSWFQGSDNGNNVTERFSDHTVNEIVKASVEMGKAKTGALIVIKQNTVLEEYERTGITLDSVVSSQLLINIFEHNTPLHDGAVIIEGNRVAAATCYLPLSENMMLNKALGTRHRAGIGMSEVTDSMVVIVSEETGCISIAFKGELQYNVTADTLREQLEVLQNKSVAPKKFKLWKGWTKNES